MTSKSLLLAQHQEGITKDVLTASTPTQKSGEIFIVVRLAQPLGFRFIVTDKLQFTTTLFYCQELSYGFFVSLFSHWKERPGQALEDSGFEPLTYCVQSSRSPN